MKNFIAWSRSCLEPPFFAWSRSRANLVGARVGSGTSDFRSRCRSRPKKWRLRNTGYFYSYSSPVVPLGLGKHYNHWPALFLCGKLRLWNDTVYLWLEVSRIQRGRGSAVSSPLYRRPSPPPGTTGSPPRLDEDDPHHFIWDNVQKVNIQGTGPRESCQPDVVGESPNGRTKTEWDVLKKTIFHYCSLLSTSILRLSAVLAAFCASSYQMARSRTRKSFFRCLLRHV